MLDRLLKFIGVRHDSEGPMYQQRHECVRPVVPAPAAGNGGGMTWPLPKVRRWLDAISNMPAWSSFSPTVKSAFKRAAPGIVTKGKWPLFAYAGLLAALALTQKRLLFNPSDATCPVVPTTDTHEITEMSLRVQGGSTLRGWLLRPEECNVFSPTIPLRYG